MKKIYIPIIITVSFLLGFLVSQNTGEYKAYKKIHSGSNVSLEEYANFIQGYPNLNAKLKEVNGFLLEEDLLSGTMALKVYRTLQKEGQEEAKSELINYVERAYNKNMGNTEQQKKFRKKVEKFLPELKEKK